jgi:hypothetical protein
MFKFIILPVMLIQVRIHQEISGCISPLGRRSCLSDVYEQLWIVGGQAIFLELQTNSDFVNCIYKPVCPVAYH